MQQIRELFSQTRKIDRRIEKVIDYRATDEARLEREISEYEVTASVERGMRRILEAFDEGARGGDVTEIGAWVSGFYGSGKSSFTKYLGFALDHTRKINGAPFVESLAVRIPSLDLRERLKTIARHHRTAVFMVDLGTDQLADSASESVANVLYWNVLKDLGFSKEKKVAELELRLERDNRLDDFRKAYAARYPGKEPWDVIHNDPTVAVGRASTLVTSFYPDDYKDPAEFRQLKVQPIENVGELAGRMIELIRRRKKCDNIIFFVDEVGQYVAPRQELILNLDGLARAFKEVGKGRVWFVATAQQTLQEISEKASLNSPELFKLKDRFPITVELEATDIRDITAKRLLTKNNEGKELLERQFVAAGEPLQMHTHLADWPGGRTTLGAEEFAKLYPFLPARFDLVLALIRALSQRTGGAGLRSAIRLVQDLLVDTSRTLPKGAVPLADRLIGQLATVDDIYDTLRHDLHKEHPQAVEGVDRIAKHPDFKDDPCAVRAAKAVAALQPLEKYPRTAENIAALLYRELGAPGDAEAVGKALHRLVDAREFGLVELRVDGPTQGGAGFIFLSDEVQPIQKKRDNYVPTQAEINRLRLDVLHNTFDPVPEARIEGTKTVQAGIRLGKGVIAGESGDVIFRLEDVEPASLEARVQAIEEETQTRDEHKNTVFWIFARPSEVEEHLMDVCRSTFIQAEGARGKDKDKTVPADVTRFLRSEERRADRAKDAAKATYQRALFKGIFVFRGRRRPVEELGTTIMGGASAFLQEVAGVVFRHFRHVKKNVPGEVAARFLEVDRLDKMPKDRDPLGLVQKKGGRPSIDTGHPALLEALRAFRELVAATGSGRVQGSALLDFFYAPPYGWSKDTSRYLFAALLMAGEVELHSGDGVLRTAGPKAVEAVRNTQSFNRIGIAPRGQPVPVEALDRASRRLEAMFGVEVLPLEDQVSRVVRTHFPTVMERVGSLPDRLRLLKLPGEPRARAFLQTCADLLKEDAGGAASLLGGVESAIPVEEKWASGVVKTLDNGGEEDIGASRGMLDRLGELADLFASVQELLHSNAVTTITEIVSSESFHQRMADLRDAQRALTRSVRALYHAEREPLLRALDEVRKRLEARPEWIRISDEDRVEIATELVATGLPEEPQEPLGALQRVLTRRLGLADLEERLARKVDRRRIFMMIANARIDDDEGDDVPSDDADAPMNLVESVPIGDLLPDAELANAADVERWIADLRARLLERVQLGPIRLTDVDRGQR
jgi:hypothetical protein